MERKDLYHMLMFIGGGIILIGGLASFLAWRFDFFIVRFCAIGLAIFCVGVVIKVVDNARTNTKD